MDEYYVGEGALYTLIHAESESQAREKAETNFLNETGFVVSFPVSRRATAEEIEHFHRKLEKLPF